MEIYSRALRLYVSHRSSPAEQVISQAPQFLMISEKGLLNSWKMAGNMEMLSYIELILKFGLR